MKLYEFSALCKCNVVIAAKSEQAAREEIKTYERAWFETGELIEVSDVELEDVRESDYPEDDAHVIVGEIKK